DFALDVLRDTFDGGFGARFVRHGCPPIIIRRSGTAFPASAADKLAPLLSFVSNHLAHDVVLPKRTIELPRRNDCPPERSPGVCPARRGHEQQGSRGLLLYPRPVPLMRERCRDLYRQTWIGAGPGSTVKLRAAGDGVAREDDQALARDPPTPSYAVRSPVLGPWMHVL